MERRDIVTFAHSLTKKRKKTTYTHRFVCLNQCDQESIPTTDKEKDSLLEAGLGERKITIEDIDMNGEEFRGLLFQEFPKLKDGGGFSFNKCRNNTRLLEPLSSLCLSSPRILRDRVGNARTYILPLQRDLDLSPVMELPPGVSYSIEILSDLFGYSLFMVKLYKQYFSSNLFL